MAAAWGKTGAAWGTGALALWCSESQGAARARGKKDPLACFPTMLCERESRLYCIYLGKGLGHFIWCSLQSSCSVLQRRKTSDSCALFQTRESKAIDTMASLVTGRVPGAGKFPTKCPRSKWQDFLFSFYPESPLSQRIFTGADSELGSDMGLGLQLRDAPESSCHIAVGFPMRKRARREDG